MRNVCKGVSRKKMDKENITGARGNTRLTSSV